MRLTSLLILSITTLGVLSRSAGAELVRFDIAGTLDNVSGLDPAPGNLPAIGSAFSGSYVFDTDAPNGSSSSPFFGTYHTPFPTGVVSLRVGDWQWKETGETPLTILVGNDVSRGPLPEYDSYFVGDSRIELLTPDFMPPSGEYWLFRWDLEGPTSIFTTTDLPDAAFNLQPWTTNRWSISLWGSPPAPLLELTGVVSSFQSVVVPEPPSILCAAFALLTLIGIRRRTSD
jgi:hypothetical protein